jgi:hypothetical protein
VPERRAAWRCGGIRNDIRIIIAAGSWCYCSFWLCYDIGDWPKVKKDKFTINELLEKNCQSDFIAKGKK